jgi:hypothetical protein
VPLKSKPRNKSNAGNNAFENKTNTSKSKAIAHLKRHLNITSDKSQKVPDKSERRQQNDKISQKVTSSIHQEQQNDSLS